MWCASTPHLKPGTRKLPKKVRNHICSVIKTGRTNKLETLIFRDALDLNTVCAWMSFVTIYISIKTFPAFIWTKNVHQQLTEGKLSRQCQYFSFQFATTQRKIVLLNVCSSRSWDIFEFLISASIQFQFWLKSFLCAPPKIHLEKYGEES